jgi:flagellar biosynthesis protein FlhG
MGDGRRTTGEANMQDQAAKLRMMAASQTNDEMGICGGEANETEQGLVGSMPNALRSTPVRTIAVTSGKGGVGKTNITANLGIAIAAQNKRVGLIDADLGLANIDVILKLKPKYNIEHVIAGKRKLEEIFIRGPAGLMVIPASSGTLSMANLPDLNRDRLIKDLIQCTLDFDIMFIDTGAGMSNVVVDFALAAKEVIVITTPEPTAITDAYAMIKVISRQRKTDIGIVVNMAKTDYQAREVAARIIIAARRYINAQAHFMGYILTDDAVADAIFAQQPLIFKYPTSGAAQCINILADKILANEKHI